MNAAKQENPEEINAILQEVWAPTSEQKKYEEMWKHPQYRRVAPGAHCAEQFLRLAQPASGSTVIDFGAGTGEGALLVVMLADGLFQKPVRVEMLDFASNCLDEDVRACLTTQSHVLGFTQHDLNKPSPITAPYGFCTDVMEHIPPEEVDGVLRNVLQGAQFVFFQISCTDDSCGALIGQKLHLSVHPPVWWKDKLHELGCTFLHWEAARDESYCKAYVTAWSTGQDLVNVGVLNVEEEQIRTNVRTNLDGGWKQVRPHEPNNFEVMILGGGPSLNGQLDQIRRARERGAKLVTLNGAYNWALEHGFKVSAQIVVDARPFNSRFTHPVVDETLYLVGSQCDPTTLEGLPKDRTWLWHTTAEMIRDILEEKCPDEWFGVPGGCTVLLRAIPLMRMLGYSRFHLYGCDSCVVDEGTQIQHHAFAQPENDGQPLFPTTLGGRVFQCTAWQIAQAQEFVSLIKFMGNFFEIEVHGGGLLAAILEHGAALDVQREMDELDMNVELP